LKLHWFFMGCKLRIFHIIVRKKNLEFSRSLQ
jgi:hypothetical protein